VFDRRREVILQLLKLLFNVALFVMRLTDLEVVPPLRDEFGDEVWILAEVGQVLGGVVAGLGLEVAERVHDRGAYLFVAALVVACGLGGFAVVAVVGQQTLRAPS